MAVAFSQKARSACITRGLAAGNSTPSTKPNASQATPRMLAGSPVERAPNFERYAWSNIAGTRGGRLIVDEELVILCADHRRQSLSLERLYDQRLGDARDPTRQTTPDFSRPSPLLAPGPRQRLPSLTDE